MPVPVKGPSPRVGAPDVELLTAKLAAVVASDNRHGGTTKVEVRAAQLARQTLALQQHGTVTSRVRGQLYSLAAAFTSSAMWAAIDGHRLDAAQQHMQQAVTLAGLSGDTAIVFRVWGHAGALYRHLGRYTDALAADDAARSTSIVRRDPLYASLAHARTAVHHGDLRDHNAVKRSIGHAHDALTRADTTAPRPPWMLFYDQAELELLGLIAHVSLHHWADAEAHAHRHLALLRPDLVRNRSWPWPTWPAPSSNKAPSKQPSPPHTPSRPTPGTAGLESSSKASPAACPASPPTTRRPGPGPTTPERKACSRDR